MPLRRRPGHPPPPPAPRDAVAPVGDSLRWAGDGGPRLVPVTNGDALVMNHGAEAALEGTAGLEMLPHSIPAQSGVKGGGDRHHLPFQGACGNGPVATFKLVSRGKAVDRFPQHNGNIRERCEAQPMTSSSLSLPLPTLSL